MSLPWRNTVTPHLNPLPFNKGRGGSNNSAGQISKSRQSLTLE